MPFSIASEIITFNRKVLQSVPTWISLEDWKSPPSVYNYGLPESVLKLIDLPISQDVTEVDILCQLALELQMVNYLEIGVSVGKTFYQMIEFCNSHLPGAKLSCLDIEDPNPVLYKLLEIKSGGAVMSEFAVDPDEIIFENGTRRAGPNKIFKWLEPSISYYSGNEFDVGIWKKLNSKFNLVFSDAYHHPIALLTEYEQLKANNLLDYKNLIYCFDDLDNSTDGEMWKSVHQIYSDIKKYKPQAQLVHEVVNGWLGQHEFPHNFGIIR